MSNEKLRFLFDRKELYSYSDHEALEEIHNKKENGTARVQRWLERFSKFDFNICYREGSKLIQVDALSREAVMVNIYNNNLESKILAIHYENRHRKNIYDLCRAESSFITNKLISESPKNCLKCCQNDKKVVKGANLLKNMYPGENMGFDLLEVKKNKYIAMAIDYFSRFAFEKIIKSKEVSEILKFLDYVYQKLKFKSMITDNGRELNNHKVKSWASIKEISIDFSIPHYHKSNGIIERLNRTVRDGLKRTSGPWSKRLENVLTIYNTRVTHRGLGITPENALLKENKDLILNKSKTYEKEFKKNNNLEVFQIKQKVLIKKDTRKTKMDKEFDRSGKIVSREGNNSYCVRLNNNKVLLRHATQLRGWPGDVGCSKDLASRSEMDCAKKGIIKTNEIKG
ncbi:Pol polyprotein [Dictyocoela muelleri]|nr:Pol polyprotein [Dictyocoela muelleri]